MIPGLPQAVDEHVDGIYIWNSAGSTPTVEQYSSAGDVVQSWQQALKTTKKTDIGFVVYEQMPQKPSKKPQANAGATSRELRQRARSGVNQGYGDWYSKLMKDTQLFRIYGGREFYLKPITGHRTRQKNLGKNDLHLNEQYASLRRTLGLPGVARAGAVGKPTTRRLKGVHVCLPDQGDKQQHMRLAAQSLQIGDGGHTNVEHMRRVAEVRYRPENDELPGTDHTIYHISHTLRKRAMVDRKDTPSSAEGVWRRRYFQIGSGKPVMALVGGSVQYDLHTCLGI